MADLGKVVVTDGGTYSASVTYEKLTFVHYNNDAYLTLKTVKGVTPTDDGVNYRLFCKSAATATTSKAGIVMPDGTTIGISNGKITAKTATQTTVGVTKGSDDVTVGKDGALSLNTKFEQAKALANIVAGEAFKVVLGKVSKAIATTMNLDENALLKNMISGIDVNDGNKVPSSAYIHTLVDRIGMGTELSGFDNLTAAVNSVNNNLSKAIARLVGNIKIGGLESRSTTEIYSSLPDGSLYFFYCDGSQGISTELGFTDVNNALCGFIYKSASWRGSGILVPMTGVGTDYNMFVGRLNGENQLKWVGVK